MRPHRAPDEPDQYGPNRPDEAAGKPHVKPWLRSGRAAAAAQDHPGWRQALARYRHALQRSEQLLRQSAPYRTALDQHSIVAITDAGGTIVYVNDLFCSISGYSRAELIGQNHRLINSGQHSHEFFNELWRTLLRGKTWRQQVCNRSKSGGLYWVDTTIVPDHDRVSGERCYISIRTDITERKRMERELMRTVHTDALTCQGNRTSLMAQLARALAHCRDRGGAPFALLSLDIDRFRRINEAWGHAVGDALLKQVATRIHGQLRPGLQAGLPIGARAHCARVGADEFAVLLEGMPGQLAVQAFALQLLRVMAEPFEVGGNSLSVSASIGIVHSSDGTDTPEAVLRDADAAVSEAQRRGRNCQVSFDTRMRAAFERSAKLAAGMRVAVRDRQIHLVYQPIVDASNGRLVGIEALARWTHPELGPVSPVEFIPIAEESGLVLPLGRIALEQACRDLVSLQARLGEQAPDHVSVNVSRVQLQSPHLPDEVRAALAASGLAPHRLQLEVTETAAMNGDRMTEALQVLDDLGVAIALDDFGTGYSALACLQQMPLNTVKLDRSFIVRLHEGGPARAIVAACVALSHALGFATVAEGIETASQAAELREIGCTHLQGYYFARPMLLPALVDWISQSSVPVPAAHTPLLT